MQAEVGADVGRIGSDGLCARVKASSALRGERRHNLEGHATYELPWRASAGAFALYQAGQPYQLESVLPYRSFTTSASDTNRLRCGVEAVALPERCVQSRRLGRPRPVRAVVLRAEAFPAHRALAVLTLTETAAHARSTRA